MNEGGRKRTPILYLAPWIDIGGTDKNTIDWFRAIDRERFAPSLITTQPSPNRRLREVADFAEEIWVLPDLMPAEDMPSFILDFLQSRGVGVLHLMNARLGFDLLPDLSCLPNPPRVVVQLHVEEADRSGYVRYVTTRYGNLVDCFSVSNKHLAEAVHDYGISRDKIRVIYIGVDAEEEFSPERVQPIEGLASDRMHILFPARLVEQKDPLLMVDVATALRDKGVRFQLHVLGEGDLEPEVEKRIAKRGLNDEVLLHPPTATPQRWYAASDAVLMTSVFEGVPAVVYEAMAMGLPVVAPALPGNVELLGEGQDGLVETRDSAEAYASKLARFAQDGDYQAMQGRQMRDRARAEFSLEQMAEAHGELYLELAELVSRRERVDRPKPEHPIRFADRPTTGTPLVSVLVPHFNQARFLSECIDSIRAQTYPEIETIVVDDASTEEGAEGVLDELEALDGVKVVRLAENGGPSRARNLGLDHCSGRYILPVDADNKLLPDAVAMLVAQLSTAGEDIGFIYPNLQYFGNREDYYEVPEYNLYTLLHGNFCDTCSLLDRQIFDAGERYREEIRLGHEDWEFVLRLAARGVRGEAARGPTVLYRKWGFNRSDLVDHASDRFDELLTEISPFKGREAEIKARESPALSILTLGRPLSRGGSADAVAARLSAQTCGDVELIDAKADLAAAVDRARGAYLAVTSGDGSALLEDPAFCEKALRRFAARGSGNELDAIALVDAGTEGRFSFRALAADDRPPGTGPHSVIWRRTAELGLPSGLLVYPGDPVASLVRLLSGAGLKVEWRHAQGEAGAGSGPPLPSWKPLPASPASVQDPHDLRPGAQPLLPGAGEYRVPRWEDLPTWVPPLSTIAIRYREPDGQRRLATSQPAPVGFLPERHLGALRSVSFAGTARVVRNGEKYESLPSGEGCRLPPGAEEIGYVELAGFPLMDGLALGIHRGTGQQVLLTTPDDPLLLEVDVVESFGHIEPFPPRPRLLPDCASRSLGLLGLTRALDLRGRRHRYAIGAMADGEVLGELGGLAESPLQGAIGAWIVDGYLITERHRPPRRRPSSFDIARWSAEPARWRGMAGPASRARVALRRAATSVARLARPTQPVASPGREPEAWLFESSRPGRAPLFAAYHPVTGDQLLARSTEDVAQLGYGTPELLGYVRKVAPVTGELAPRSVSIPWARRFGAVPQVG
jgi:glycosyltransferase involved in cell wall biosynthesis